MPEAAHLANVLACLVSRKARRVLHAPLEPVDMHMLNPIALKPLLQRESTWFVSFCCHYHQLHDIHSPLEGVACQ